MKNEGKEESGGEESEEEATESGNLEASTMTTTSLPSQAQKLQQQPLTSEPSKNVLVGAASHEMFMSSETTAGELGDRPKHEIVSMKDKYAGKAPFLYLEHF